MGIRPFDTERDMHGARVVLRAPLNVPIEKGIVTNLYRIEKAIPTIELLAKKGARTVVLGHIGRAQTDSLEPVWKELKRCTTVSIQFVRDVAGNEAQSAVQSLKDGEVLLLENVRREKGETENDKELSKTFASYGDVFINDSFAASHRLHASIVGVPQFIKESFAGPLFMEEIEGVSPARDPESPSLAVIGGAKFMTKQPLIEHLFKTYDHVFIGGALAHDFFVAKGMEVGRSLVSRAAEVAPLLKNSKLILPEDAMVLTTEKSIEVKKIEEVTTGDTIYDIGPESVKKLNPLIQKARFVLWNGPMGNFEHGFSHGTETLAHAVANARGVSVVGGGDTIASIQNLNLKDKFNHVSTAGGAMLEFIAKGTLPGIEALK